MSEVSLCCDPDRLSDSFYLEGFLKRVRRWQTSGASVFVYMRDSKICDYMEKRENQSADQVVFMDLVQRMYSPTSLSGKTAQPQEAVEYKTSRELQYSLRESCEPTVAEISQWMMQMGFQGVPKGGTFYWMLYERDCGDAAAHPTE